MTSRNRNKFLDTLPLEKVADDSKPIFIVEIRLVCRLYKVVRLQIKDIPKIIGALFATLFLPSIFYLLKLLLEIAFIVISNINAPA